MAKQEAWVGIDPGGTTGVCVLDREGNILDTEQLKFDQLIDCFSNLVADYDIKHVVVENFITFGHKAMQQTGSKVPAARVIGAVNVWAKLMKLPVTLQMSSILPIAEKWSRINFKKAGAHKDTHWVAAYLHVFYWMVQHQIIKTQFAKEAENEAKH